jgi:hypothetical protein
MSCKLWEGWSLGLDWISSWVKIGVSLIRIRLIKIMIRIYLNTSILIKGGIYYLIVSFYCKSIFKYEFYSEFVSICNYNNGIYAN